MKHVAVAAIALVLGLILGGLGPRNDMRKLEKKYAEMDDGPCKSTLGTDLAALMGGGFGQEPDARPTRNDRRPATNPLGDRDPDVIAAENPEAAELVAEMESEDGAEELAEDLAEGLDEEQLQLARTALELRRAQARAALVEDAEPDETQLESIDIAVNEMNESLTNLAEELTTMIADGEEPTRRDAMEFAADALDTMLLAEDAMRGALDPDQLDLLDDGSLDPFSYVDPSLVDTLEKLGQTEE